MAGNDLRRTEARPPEPAVTLGLSAAAKAALTPAARAVDELLARSGGAIFGNALRSLRPYPENLSAIIENPRSTREQQIAANDALNAREFLAFGVYTTTSTLDFARAYIQYYDSLSPEEQNSNRYKGTREEMVGVAKRAAAEEGKPTGDLDKPQDPILILLDDLEELAFRLTDENFGSSIRAYREQLADLFNAGRYADLADRAVDRLRDIQALIGAARTGDEAAFGHLTTLASDSTQLLKVIAYGRKLATA